MTTVTEVRNASFGLVLHAHHILQILLIFSSPEGYWLQFSIPCAYFVYTVWHCTGQHCSIYVYVSFVCRYVAPPGECYYNTLLCWDYFSSSSVVSCAFSALRMYSKFKHHCHPLGYLCAKFCLFDNLHCWASTWRKIAYSINHSPNLFDAPGTKASTSEYTEGIKAGVLRTRMLPASNVSQLLLTACDVSVETRQEKMIVTLTWIQL